jgi:uncharacterized protein YraI
MKIFWRRLQDQDYMTRYWILALSVLLLTGVAAAQETSITATAYGTINVRSGPGAQYEIVGQLSAGERVPVDGRDSETSGWLRILLEEELRGWVASFAVLLDGDAATLPIILTDTPAPGDENPPTVTAYGQVNIRSGPGMQYDIVGQLDVDDTAVITGHNNDESTWLYIEAEDVKGWVAYFTVSIQGNLDNLPILVVPGTGEGVALPDEVVSARFNVRLRQEPDPTSTVLDIVPFRGVVSPLARSEDSEWLYVVYEDVYGWGAARLFDIIPQQLDSLPVYNPHLFPTVEPEVTPNPDAEG